MDTIFDRCAGLDVHKETVVTCVRRIVNGKVQREVRTFNTTTEDLQTLLSWLKETGCTHVAMEATGVYWKPIWNILSDGDFDLVLPMPNTSRMCLAERPTSMMRCGSPTCCPAG